MLTAVLLIIIAGSSLLNSYLLVNNRLLTRKLERTILAHNEYREGLVKTSEETIAKLREICKAYPQPHEDGYLSQEDLQAIVDDFNNTKFLN